MSEIINASGDSCEIDVLQNLENGKNRKICDEDAAKGDGVSKSDSLGSKDEFLNRIDVLEKKVEKTATERNEYRKKLEETEKTLENLKSLANGNEIEIGLRIQMEDLKNKLTQTQLQLGDRARVVANQENQIKALNNQVSSLKEVIQITKDLLEIRNTEVKHLQTDVQTMDTKISAERDRHKNMKIKMDTAVRLNEDLKKEYETQLRLFQDLRGQYEKKVTLLTEENKSLEESNQTLKTSV